MWDRIWCWVLITAGTMPSSAELGQGLWDQREGEAVEEFTRVAIAGLQQQGNVTLEDAEISSQLIQLGVACLPYRKYCWRRSKQTSMLISMSSLISNQLHNVVHNYLLRI